MTTLAIGSSAVGLVTVLTAWGTYLATIPGGKVPARPIGTIILQVAGIVLAISAVVLSFRDGRSPGLAVIIPAGIALMMGSTFFYFLSQRKTPIGDLKIKVGDTLLPFEATTSDGVVFHTDSLEGKRTLLKFFRGGW
jgi:hypothetical protein